MLSSTGPTPKTSPMYLTKEFNDLIKSCPPEKIDLVYKMAELIIKHE